MSEKNKLHTGELYLPGDNEIMEYQTQCLERLYDFNATRPSEFEKRTELLKEMFAEIGDGCYTRLYCKMTHFAMLGNFAERRRSRQEPSFILPSQSYALQPPLAALQTMVLFAIEGSIYRASVPFKLRRGTLSFRQRCVRQFQSDPR